MQPFFINLQLYEKLYEKSKRFPIRLATSFENAERRWRYKLQYLSLPKI